MPSNLNIKYGQKTGTGNTLKSQDNPGVTPGNIYAAENSAGEIEMYIDTPKNSGSERKRLDPRIYVGATPSGGVNAIWDNYDVWIDTSGDPTGNATPGASLAQSTSGLMSANAIFGLSQILTELKNLKIQIVTQSYWNSNDNINEPRNKNDTSNLTKWLTIVVPDSAGPNYDPEEGANQNLHPKDCLLEWDFNSINVTPQSGGSGS